MVTNSKWGKKKSGKYVSPKPAATSGVSLVIRTGFVSQDEKNKTTGHNMKGNKIMDFPDISPQTRPKGAVQKVFNVAPRQRKTKLGNYPPNQGL